MIDFFEAQRPALRCLAYQMLGSVVDAEEVLQEAWLRWNTATAVEFPGAWLRKVVTRLCLDEMKTARARREVYVGPWLPEPMVESKDQPAMQDITVALLLTLERLTPLERAAFLLHDVMEVPFDEIGHSLQREPATCRKLASRARTHVHRGRPRFSVNSSAAARLTEAFLCAARTGDAQRLTALLAHDVALHTDGGGKRLAAMRVIEGSDRVVRLLVGLHRRGFGLAGAASIEPAIINGLPGFVLVDKNTDMSTYAFDLYNDKVQAVYVMRNPDKLGHLAAWSLDGRVVGPRDPDVV